MKYVLDHYCDSIENNTDESMTIPGQAYSMREIYQRWQMGLPVTCSRAVEYDFEGSEESFEINAAHRLDSDITDVAAELRDIECELRSINLRNEVSSAPGATAQVRPSATADGANEK